MTHVCITASGNVNAGDQVGILARADSSAEPSGVCVDTSLEVANSYTHLHFQVQPEGKGSIDPSGYYE